MMRSLAKIARYCSDGRQVVCAIIVLTFLCDHSFADVKQSIAKITQLDGTVQQTSLQELGPDRLVVQSVGEKNDLSGIDRDKVLTLEFANTTPRFTQAPVIEFANGDRLTATIDSVRDESLFIRSGDNDLQIPLERLRGIAFRSLSVHDGTAAIMHRLVGSDDLLLLTNGDRLSGHFVGLSTAELLIESDGRSVNVPRERVAAVAFSPDLIAQPQEQPVRQLVQFTAGWLTVRDLTRDRNGVWRGRTDLGGDVTWQEEEILRILFLSNRVQLLSDLKPVEERIDTYLGRGGLVRPNRSITGEPLSASGVPYARGLGVQSRSRLMYQLNGEYDTFSTVAGLADSAGNIGCVEFAIEVDGEEVRRSPPISKATEPFRVERLELKSASTITLVVDFAHNGDILDRANWCMPILVRPAT